MKWRFEWHTQLIKEDDKTLVSISRTSQKSVKTFKSYDIVVLLSKNKNENPEKQTPGWETNTSWIFMKRLFHSLLYSFVVWQQGWQVTAWGLETAKSMWRLWKRKLVQEMERSLEAMWGAANDSPEQNVVFKPTTQLTDFHFCFFLGFFCVHHYISQHRWSPEATALMGHCCKAANLFIYF